MEKEKVERNCKEEKELPFVRFVGFQFFRSDTTTDKQWLSPLGKIRQNCRRPFR